MAILIIIVVETSKSSVTALSLVFLLIASSISFTSFESLDDAAVLMDSDTSLDLTVKIHKPGALFDDEQTLVWSPNNITENREMQISVHTEKINQINDLSSLNLKWIFHSENMDFTYSEFNTTDYETNSSDNGIVITTFFTYEEDKWSGNYTLFATLNLNDGSSMNGSSNKIIMKEQDFFIIMNGNNAENFVCACEPAKFNFIILNSGSSETFFDMTINPSYVEYKPFSIDLTEADNDNDGSIGDVISLSGGESYSLILEFIPNNQLQTNRSYDIRPLDINIVYENDDEEFIELYDGIPSYSVFSLPEFSNPKATVTLDQFNYQKIFNTNQNYIDNNETVYTLGKDELTLQYEVHYRGYSTSKINLRSETPLLDFRIIYDGSNLTLTDFNVMTNNLEQNQTINFDVYVKFDPLIVDLLFELDIALLDSLVTNTAIRFSYSPTGNDSIISTPDETVVFEFKEQRKVVQLDIDTSLIGELLYFENIWTIHCIHSDGVLITIINLDNFCNGDKKNLPVNINSSINIELSVTNWENNNSHQVQVILSHNPSAVTSYLSENISLTLILNQSQDNDNQTNLVDESNGTVIDDNYTNLDADNDGIFDSQDNCLESTPNATVDEYGCVILEQNANKEEIDESNNANDTGKNRGLLYIIGVLVIIFLCGGLLMKKSRKFHNRHEYSSIILDDEKLTTPVMPLPALEPVVLQQWTDANGYSWRQMSDQTIMWWNGTDWIPYGKN